MFAVVLPYSHEVGLLGDVGGLLVREHKVLLFEDFWCEFAESFVLTFEGGATLGSGGVHTEDHLSVLVSVSEGPQKAIAFLLIVWLAEHVATVSPSSWLWYFVVEQS